MEGKKPKTYKTGIAQEIIDENTGEVFRQSVITEHIEGFRDVKLPDRARFNNGSFITLFQASMLVIATNAKKTKMTKEELIILLYLLGTAGIANSVILNYAEIVAETGIDKANVSRAIKALKSKMVIIETTQERRYRKSVDRELSLNFDQLNYNLAWNGKTKDFGKMKHKHPPLQLEGTISPNQIDIFGNLAGEKK
jgi:hypothetical protein